MSGKCAPAQASQSDSDGPRRQSRAFSAIVWRWLLTWDPRPTGKLPWRPFQETIVQALNNHLPFSIYICSPSVCTERVSKREGLILGPLLYLFTLQGRYAFLLIKISVGYMYNCYYPFHMFFCFVFLSRVNSSLIKNIQLHHDASWWPAV